MTSKPGTVPVSAVVRLLAAVLVIAAGSAGPCGDGFALIVGVNACPAFRLPDGSRPRPLQGAENDADALADLLIQQFGFDPRNVVMLKGPDATREKIRLAFTDLAKRTRPEDQFVFHYSGHGTQIADVRPFDEPDGRDEAYAPGTPMRTVRI